MNWWPASYPIFALVASVVSALAALLIWRRRSSPGAPYLAAAIAATAEWNASLAFEAIASDVPTKLLWSKIQYLGVASLTTLLLAFALEYAGLSLRRRPRYAALLCVGPGAVALLAWTNDWHGWLWGSVAHAGDANVLIYGRGPLFPLVLGYHVMSLTAAVVVLALASLQLSRPRRPRLAAVVASFLPAFGVGMLYGLDPAIAGGVDVTSFGLLISVLSLGWVLERHQLFDLVPLARNTLLEEMPDGLLVLDRQGSIADVNPAAGRLLGLPGIAVGQDAHSALSPYPDLLSPPPDGTEVELEVQREGTGRGYLAVRVSPLHDRSGRPAGQLISLRDVTARRQLVEQLAMATRLETAGRMAAQVSHDFNNLLVPMTAYPDLIKLQLPEGHPAGQFCDAMTEAAQQMARINEDMMILGQRGHFGYEPTDLNRVVKQALSNLPAPAGSLETRLELAPDLFPVNGSSAQLLRVVMNLVSNAREAMGEGGSLLLRTENVCLDSPIRGFVRVEPGEYVLLIVSDTGTGIPGEVIERIFDPFFSTKRGAGRRGAGLGLAIVQSVVADHRGFVDLRSEVGGGTTFHLYLPPCHQPLQECDVEPVPRGCESILVVDDDPLQRKAATMMLRSLGYLVEAVASGEEAVTRLPARPADLLVLDMVMPGGMDGTESYRKALEVSPGQRAILVSGYAESERVKEAQRLGAGPYVRKPVTLVELARVVREELDAPRRGSGNAAEPSPCLMATDLRTGR